MIRLYAAATVLEAFQNTCLNIMVAWRLPAQHAIDDAGDLNEMLAARSAVCAGNSNFCFDQKSIPRFHELEMPTSGCTG